MSIPDDLKMTTTEALRWAMDYIADDATDDDGTPPHGCEFATNPLKGACDFHVQYWAAREALAKAEGSPFPGDTP